MWLQPLSVWGCLFAVKGMLWLHDRKYQITCNDVSMVTATYITACPLQPIPDLQCKIGLNRTRGNASLQHVALITCMCLLLIGS